MSDIKILHVDFSTKKLLTVEQIKFIEKKEKLDPVLERIKSKMDPEQFKLYKATVDHWMTCCFEYEMEQKNKN